MASSDSHIHKPQRGRPKRAELPDNTESLFDELLTFYELHNLSAHVLNYTHLYTYAEMQPAIAVLSFPSAALSPSQSLHFSLFFFWMKMLPNPTKRSWPHPATA